MEISAVTGVAHMEAAIEPSELHVQEEPGGSPGFSNGPFFLYKPRTVHLQKMEKRRVASDITLYSKSTTGK